MICFWVRLKRAFKREGPGLRLRLLQASSASIEDEGEGRGGEAEEEEEEDNSRIGERRRASASPIFKQETCTMPHGVVRLPTIAATEKRQAQFAPICAKCAVSAI